MAHPTHTMHANSLAAYADLDLDPREKLCLAAYETAAGPLTDRECAYALGFDDLNACRPRITSLLKKGKLREWGNVKCSITGKTVRACEVVK